MGCSLLDFILSEPITCPQDDSVHGVHFLFPVPLNAFSFEEGDNMHFPMVIVDNTRITFCCSRTSIYYEMETSNMRVHILQHLYRQV